VTIDNSTSSHWDVSLNPISIWLQQEADAVTSMMRVGYHHTWLPLGCIDGGESRSFEREQGSKGAPSCFQQTMQLEKDKMLLCCCDHCLHRRCHSWEAHLSVGVRWLSLHGAESRSGSGMRLEICCAGGKFPGHIVSINEMKLVNSEKAT